MTMTDAERAAMIQPTFVTNDDGLVAATLTDNEHRVLRTLWEAPGRHALLPEPAITLWRAARAHYTSQARPPREPTEAMKRAGDAAWDVTRQSDDAQVCGEIWQAMYDAAPASAPAPAASNHKRDCRILSTERLDPGQRYCDCGYEAQMPRTYVAAEAGSGAAPDAEVDTLATYAASANEKCNKAWLVHIARSCASALTALRERVAELERERDEAKEDASRNAEKAVAFDLMNDLRIAAMTKRDALAAQVERLTVALREYLRAVDVAGVNSGKCQCVPMNTGPDPDPGFQCETCFLQDAAIAASAALAQSTPEGV